MLSLPERLAGRALQATGFARDVVRTELGEIHYLRGEGHGELPFVLLHGLSANAIAYGDLMRRILPTVSTLVAPDMPGHGYSPVPHGGLDANKMTDAMFEALDRIIDRPAVLLGNSMGGMAAVRYAAARPEKVRGLLLISPGGAPMDAATLERVLSIFRIENHRQGLDFVERIFAKSPPLMRHAIAQGSKIRFAHPVMRGFIDSISSDDLLQPDEIARLVMPTLLVWGNQEKVLPESSLSWFADHMPEHGVIERWQDFGHIGFMERPAALARRIDLFLKELAGRERVQRELRLPRSPARSRRRHAAATLGA